MQIGPGDLDDPRVVAFLEQHVVQLRSISPPKSTHVLDLAGLRSADVTCWTAVDDGELVGCAAIKALDTGHAELKSMRTAPHRTGEGIASALLLVALEHARRRGFARVSLETGAQAFFAPAHALYARHGFTECEPFGDYRPDPLSTFMTRVL